MVGDRAAVANNPRGVPRADDRKVLNGIFWRLRTGSPWADIPERYGPSTTCYNRVVRWRKAGECQEFRVWGKLGRKESSDAPPQTTCHSGCPA